MPRKPSPQQAANPLRQLRALLAQPGKGTLSQFELGQLLGLNLDAIKSLEYNRAELNYRHWEKIQYETGAVWHREDKRWRFWEVNGPLYTREHYQTYRELLKRNHAGNLALDAFTVHEKVRILLGKADSKHGLQFLFALNQFLEDWRRKLCPHNFQSFFENLTTLIEVQPDRGREQPMTLLRTYREPLLTYILDREPLVRMKLDPKDWEHQEQTESQLVLRQQPATAQSAQPQKRARKSAA
jgi:hypothetical protein